jgi:hypothetical protein
MSVHRTARQRKRLFRAALALDGLTFTKWCEMRGITLPHLSGVLAGKRESARLLAAVDEYTDARLAAHADSAA